MCRFTDSLSTERSRAFLTLTWLLCALIAGVCSDARANPVDYVGYSFSSHIYPAGGYFIVDKNVENVLNIVDPIYMSGGGYLLTGASAAFENNLSATSPVSYVPGVSASLYFGFDGTTSASLDFYNTPLVFP
jgi:hypothetical protein